MIFKLFVINQLQILFFFKSLFSVTFWCHFWRYHRFWWNFLMNTKNEDFFSKLSKFFDIFLVSVFNWELFWFSSNSLKNTQISPNFHWKGQIWLIFGDKMTILEMMFSADYKHKKSLVWTFIWILDFMSVNLDLLPWVFIFGPILIGWTFGPLLTDLDLWMCHFGPEYLDLFRPLLFIMKGEFSCWKNRNELKKKWRFY